MTSGRSCLLMSCDQEAIFNHIIYHVVFRIPGIYVPSVQYKYAAAKLHNVLSRGRGMIAVWAIKSSWW